MLDIELLFERAVQLLSKESGARWGLAEIAYRIVGSPEGRAGATRQLADLLGKSSVDPIEHWAKAWRLYRVLSRSMADSFADLYQREFTVSHFHKMWVLGHKYDLHLKQIYKYFGMLLLEKESGKKWSVAALEALVMGDQESSTSVSWRWHWNRITSYDLRSLLSFDGELPLVVKAWARMGLGLKNKVK